MHLGYIVEFFQNIRNNIYICPSTDDRIVCSPPSLSRTHAYDLMAFITYLSIVLCVQVIMATLLLAAAALSEAGFVAYHAPAVVAAPTVYAAPAPALIRTPSLDSAVVHSERVGGNFAYSTVEGHAYTALSPVVHHAPAPVAVAYKAQPIVAPLPVVHAAAPLPAVYAPAKTFYYAH